MDALHNLIPPPGDPRTADYVEGLAREASQHNRRTAWLEEYERSYSLYTGDHFLTAENPDAVRVVLNRILGCVVSQIAIQAGDPPRVTFTPRETGEVPVVYLNTEHPDGQQLGAILFAEAMVNGIPFDPAAPLPPQVAENIKNDIEWGQMLVLQAMAAGLPKPKVIDKDAIVEVSDATTSSALQTIFDAMAEECGLHFAFTENILTKNVSGFAPTVYQWSDRDKQHQLRNPPPQQILPDPTVTCMKEAAYVVFELPEDALKAVAMYPHLYDAIMAEAVPSGSIQWIGQRFSGAGTSQVYEATFERPMIVIRTVWIRNYPYPMEEAEAIAEGSVELRAVPTGQMVTEIDEMTGQPFEVDQNRDAYFLPGSPAEVTPDLPEWPHKPGIRCVRVIANEVVDDFQWEGGDIPVPWNRNVPIPNSPYGQGEPVRLEGLQTAINNVLSSMVTHHAYNACPPELVPESVVARLDKQLQNARAKPGTRLHVPDELIAQLGDIKKIISHLDAAPMPADFWRLLDLLLQLIDKEGNQAEVLSGNASPSWSGEAIASLQNAASQVVRAKSMFTEFYLKDLAELMVHSIVHRMTVEDWKRYVSRYPHQALQALYDKAKALHVDVAVEITSGSGAAKQSQTNNLMLARQAGVPISPQTVMERFDIDPDAEQQRNAEWLRKEAAAQAQAMSGPDAPAGAGGAGAGAPGDKPAANNAKTAA